MSTEPSRVIILPGRTANTSQVYHQEFPEVRADGPDPKTAATHLVNQLTRALDSALTDWRRSTLEAAIKEVQAFVDGRGES